MGATRVDRLETSELVGRLLGDVGVLLVVGDDDLGRQSAELAVELLDRQIEPVADVYAKPGARTGERGHEADLDPVGSMDGAGKHQRGSKGSQAKRHRILRRQSESAKL